MEHPTFYRTTQINGLSILYRKAGPQDAPFVGYGVSDVQASMKETLFFN